MYGWVCFIDPNQAIRFVGRHDGAHGCGASGRPEGREALNEQLHPAAPHHLPFFVPGADGADTLMVVMGVFLVATLLWAGTLYWKLHSLPERMAHKSQKLQMEIVAVLGLISLFTHMHIFWIAGLLLAMIDLPDFGTPMRSIADSVERIANTTPGTLSAEAKVESVTGAKADVQPSIRQGVHDHA
jgi:hypothetical protein